ncbi:ubiquitin carboxyl-terminal hydrolase 17-like protein 6 [Daphnia pulicaria]|uniref:ubiquitin carboxyl-terminal hydrolase 17-like protein 6 n=1 Tax=Daphnia pulicaria TaxID=35523 RepID=UPI001EECDA4C|nr:ubiquitin carboxyl-terminal hydrolase 17-like protein 6 [Daphnia pulicaria]
MPIPLLYQRQKKQENLFDLLKRQGAATSLTSEEDLSAEKTSSSQLPNYVSIFTTANSYNLRSKSSQKDEITEILEGTSTEATSTPKQSKMPDFSRNSSLDDKLSLENLCLLHKDKHTEGLFEDALIPCNNRDCRYYNLFDNSKKKSKENKLTTHTSVRKRIRFFRPEDEQDEDNKACVETNSTGTIPVKSFYNKQAKSLSRSPSPVQNLNVSPIPSLVTVDELTGSDSQTSHERPWTRSRPYILSDPTITYPPYDIGLRNIDNTCYVNATLQALFALPGFTDDLVTAFEGTENLPHFASLLANMIAARKKGLPIEVDKINEDLVKNLWMLHPSYSVREQQDASEFLIRLIEHLKLALPAGPINPVESHFECEMIEVVHCTACGKKKKRAQKHTSICLPMPKDSRNLEQCLEDYMAEEERELACSSCKATTSKISSKFRTLPSKLIMSVNRFSKEAKLAKHIVPPQVLDIRPFLENLESQLPSEYTLAAQIVHIGRSKNSGHYVSHVYCEDGVWRCYDDMSVLTVSIEDEIESVDGEPAYVYFYVHQCRFQD